MEESMKQLEMEIKKLLTLSQEVGQSVFIEGKLPHIIGHLDDVEIGVDQALAAQRADDGYVLPRWLGNLHRRVRETIRVYTGHNTEILDRLQNGNTDTETFLDYATGRIIGVVQAYIQQEVAKAIAREGSSQLPLQEARENPREQGDTHTYLVLRLLIEDRKTVTPSQLRRMGLVPEFERVEQYGTLLKSMAYDGYLKNSGRKGRELVRMVTEKGRQRYEAVRTR